MLATLQYRAVLPIRQLTDLIYPREWGPSVATEFHEQKVAVAWRVILIFEKALFIYGASALLISLCPVSGFLFSFLKIMG